jgi:hypothetical protein
MSRPPDDENPGDIKGLFGELSQELEDAGFVDNDIRDELIVGIQDSLRALFGDLMDHDPPNVTVVEGGRDEDSPPSDSPPPVLKVAASSTSEEEDFERHEDMSFDAPNVSVRLVRPSSSIPIHTLSSGNIHLPSEGDEQSIYIGTSAKMYRILLFKGKIEVKNGTGVLGVLNEKQTIDIEGERIEVRALSEEVSGTYSLIEVEQ